MHIEATAAMIQWAQEQLMVAAEFGVTHVILVL
jgi:hypothetical protein